MVYFPLGGFTLNVTSLSQTSNLFCISSGVSIISNKHHSPSSDSPLSSLSPLSSSCSTSFLSSLWASCSPSASTHPALFLYITSLPSLCPSTLPASCSPISIAGG